MSSTNAPALPAATARAVAGRYLSCLRLQDVVALQGTPLLGAIAAIHWPEAGDVPRLATLVVANVLLITHVIALNDWSGLAADLEDPNKAARVFTARGVERGEVAKLTAGLLVASLLLFALLGPVTSSLALAIAALSALYSLPRFDWKGRPLLSSAAHLVGGLLHFLLGYSLGAGLDRRGLLLGSFFAIVFTAGHLTQEVRDHRGDAANGIRTNAVAFGRRTVFLASLALFTLAHALLLALVLQGDLPRPVALLAGLHAVHLYWAWKASRRGLTYASVSRLQTGYRVLYAVMGVALIAALC